MRVGGEWEVNHADDDSRVHTTEEMQLEETKRLSRKTFLVLRAARIEARRRRLCGSTGPVLSLPELRSVAARSQQYYEERYLRFIKFVLTHGLQTLDNLDWALTEFRDELYAGGGAWREDNGNCS